MKEILKNFLKKYFPEIYLKIIFKRATGQSLNLKTPQTFSEKIQWLKLYDYPRNDLVIECADKYRMHDYLKRKGLSQYSVKILGVWDNIDDIDWDVLPKKFVLKMTHGCNFNIFVDNKNNIDISEVRSKIERWGKIDYGDYTLETQYSKIKPLIIAEEFLELDKHGLEYNFHCFNGITKYCRVMVYDDVENKISKGTCYSTPEWQKIDFNYPKYELPEIIPPPENLNEMLKVCDLISQDFKFVRIDFLKLENGEIILGELTFTPASGMSQNLRDEALLEMGNWLKI